MSTEIDVATVALLLLDMQNDVVNPRGAFAPRESEQDHVSAAIANAGAALTWARENNVPVAHVAVRFRPGHPECDASVPLFDAVAQGNALVEGTWGANFAPEVTPRDGEWVVAKRGIDGFAGNDLPLLLSRSGRTTVMLAGVSTSLVVLCTAFTSVDHGLRPIIIADACAGSTEADHRQALGLALPVAEQITVRDLLRHR